MLLCWHFWKTFELQFSPFLGLPEQERMGDAGAAQVMLSQHLHPCWLTLRWFGAWIFPRVDLAGKPGTNLMFCVQILANKHPQWWGSSWALPRAVTPSPTEHIYIWITSTSSYVSCFLLFRLNFLLSAFQANFVGKGNLKMLHWLISQYREAEPKEFKPRDEQPWGHQYQQKKIGLKQHLNLPWIKHQ